MSFRRVSMTDAEKIPLEFEFDFNHTKTKELDKKLLSGEITFEEWENALQKHVDNRLSELD